METGDMLGLHSSITFALDQHLKILESSQKRYQIAYCIPLPNDLLHLK